MAVLGKDVEERNIHLLATLQKVVILLTEKHLQSGNLGPALLILGLELIPNVDRLLFVILVILISVLQVNFFLIYQKLFYYLYI